MKKRKNARRTRRNRLRYRPPRWKNRRKIYNKQKDGWLPPSIQASLLTYINIVKYFNKYVNIDKVRYEYNNFDIQKLKGLNIQGIQYQQGLLYQEENIKSYVRKRDNYTCQKCNKHIKDLQNIKLQVHHILPKSKGGTNVPNNLITLCEKCHKQIHEYLKSNKKVQFKIKDYKEDTRLNILKDKIYKELIKSKYTVEKTYGYETKIIRDQYKLAKEHYIDARIIAAGSLKRSRNDVQIYRMTKIRNHNRKIYKDKIYKGNMKRLNQQQYIKNGYRRYDIVKYLNRYWYIDGRQENGQVVCRRKKECWVKILMKTKQDKIELKKEIKPKWNKVKLIQKASKYIWN